MINPDIIQSLPSYRRSKDPLEDVRGENLVSSEYGKNGLCGTALMRHKRNPNLVVTQSWHTFDAPGFPTKSTWGVISREDARPFVGNII